MLDRSIWACKYAFINEIIILHTCGYWLSFVYYLDVLFQKIDVMGRLVDDLITKTHEFLQPNPGQYWHISHIVVDDSMLVSMVDSWHLDDTIDWIWTRFKQYRWTVDNLCTCILRAVMQLYTWFWVSRNKIYQSWFCTLLGPSFKYLKYCQIYLSCNLPAKIRWVIMIKLASW